MFNKRIVLGLIVVAWLVPVTSQASYRFGVGGYLGGLISGGAEFRFYLPANEKTSFFIAPHAVLLVQESEFEFYSLGLKSGFMFFPDFWASPIVGIGCGITGDRYSDYYYGGSYQSYRNVKGGRLFGGVSLAPRMMRASEAKRSDILRLEIDMALAYKMFSPRQRYNWETDRYETYQPDPELRFPSIGVGIHFSW